MAAHDEFEAAIHTAGKAGAVQALAAVQSVLTTLGRLSENRNVAELMAVLGADFAVGWEAFSHVVEDIVGALHRQAIDLPVTQGSAEGELVHLRPSLLDHTIRESLQKHLTRR